MRTGMFFCLGIIAGFAFGQAPGQIEPPLVKVKLPDGNVSFAAGTMVYSNQIVKNQPYLGDATTETTQTLSDGTHINQKSGYSIYRDAEGRMRRESGNEVTISDPATGSSYFLDTKNQTARKAPFAAKIKTGAAGAPVAVKAGGVLSPDDIKRAAIGFNIAVPPPGTGGVLAQGPNVMFFSKFENAQQNQIANENLGSQVIEGVAAEGTRMTVTIPQGAIGNDRALQIVDERWYSSELQIPIMTKHMDPREGETVYRLTNIRRIQPDPSLFQIPPGYQMTKMKE
jgi:hypothetical protein